MFRIVRKSIQFYAFMAANNRFCAKYFIVVNLYFLSWQKWQNVLDFILI